MHGREDASPGQSRPRPGKLSVTSEKAGQHLKKATVGQWAAAVTLMLSLAGAVTLAAHRHSLSEVIGLLFAQETGPPEVAGYVSKTLWLAVGGGALGLGLAGWLLTLHRGGNRPSDNRGGRLLIAAAALGLILAGGLMVYGTNGVRSTFNHGKMNLGAFAGNIESADRATSIGLFTALGAVVVLVPGTWSVMRRRDRGDSDLPRATVGAHIALATGLLALLVPASALVLFHLSTLQIESAYLAGAGGRPDAAALVAATDRQLLSALVGAIGLAVAGLAMLGWIGLLPCRRSSSA